MSNPVSFSVRRARFVNRVYARLAVRSKAAKGFVSQPEPRTIGSFARGRQLVAGNCLLLGLLLGLGLELGMGMGLQLRPGRGCGCGHGYGYGCGSGCA